MFCVQEFEHSRVGSTTVRLQSVNYVAIHSFRIEQQCFTILNEILRLNWILGIVESLRDFVTICGEIRIIQNNPKISSTLLWRV